MTLQEQKELINYEIEAKRKAKDKELSDWSNIGCFALLFFIILAIIAQCSAN